jgi:hypothetical protein
MGCGGGSSGSSSGTTPTAAGKQNGSGPTIEQVVAVSRKNPGLKTCKKISHGVFDNTPDSPTDALEILSITCDGASVGSYARYPNAAARAAGDNITRRPYLVNGPIRITTGEAILAHIDADAWATMPSELRAACNCGQLHTPKG